MLAEAARLTRHGPLVWLCATTRGGVAFLLKAGGAVHVPLPAPTTEQVATWTEQLTGVGPGRLAPILREMWSAVMGPVLDACPGAPQQLIRAPVACTSLMDR